MTFERKRKVRSGLFAEQRFVEFWCDSEGTRWEECRVRIGGKTCLNGWQESHGKEREKTRMQEDSKTGN